jgi:hypothetical protein
MFYARPSALLLPLPPKLKPAVFSSTLKKPFLCVLLLLKWVIHSLLTVLLLKPIMPLLTVSYTLKFA